MPARQKQVKNTPCWWRRYQCGHRLPVATVGDKCIFNGPPDAIAVGSPTVTVYGKPVARMGNAKLLINGKFNIQFY
jgi:hypothetical protein